MNKNRFMFENYFHRINSENIKEELLKLGIISHDIQGEARDSLELLNEIMTILDELLDNEEYITFNYLVRLIVGERHANRFIDMFFNENTW